MPERLIMHDVPCPLCGSEAHAPVLQTPDWTGSVEGEFQIVRCRDCRHAYLNPAPTDASLAACYPDDYGPHQRIVDEAAQADDAEPCAPTLAESTPTDGAAAGPTGQRESEPAQPLTSPRRQPWYLSPLVRNIPGPRAYYRWVTETKSVWVPPGTGEGKRALELGCSSGWFLAQLQERGWSPVGIDLVAGPLAQARAAGFDVHEGTLDSVSFDAESFDAVFAWMVIEHVPRPRETLQGIRCVLRPGGSFALSVPNLSCWEPSLFGRHWRGYDLPRHLQHFTPRRLQSLLAEEGFEVEAVIHQPNFLFWTGSLGSWLRLRFPRRPLGEALMGAYENTPPLACYLTLGPLARLNALLKQSGRLTIVTRRK